MLKRCVAVCLLAHTIVWANDTPRILSSSRSIESRISLDELQQITNEAFEEVERENAQESLHLSKVKKAVRSTTAKGFAFRKPSYSILQKSRTLGKGLLATSKRIASRLNLSKQEDIQRVLKDITIKSPRACLDATVTCTSTDKYRNSDGSCNNVDNASWGAAEQQFQRYLTAVYANGIDTPRSQSTTVGVDLPNPRTISSALRTSSAQATTMSNLVTVWGQHLDHDITKTPESAAYATDGVTVLSFDCCEDGKTTASNFSDCSPIDVSADRFYNRKADVQCLRFVRSMQAANGCSLPSHREQGNEITSFIDGSNLYGSSEDEELKLRSFSGGLMKVNTAVENGCETTPSTPVSCPFSAMLPQDSDSLFYAGDTRCNENPYLTSLHVIWLRVHNAIATELTVKNTAWVDEDLYEETRRIVTALMQSITYGEFLPIVLGSNSMSSNKLSLSADYTYDSTDNPSIVNSFATAAYRFGHTLVKGTLSASGGNIIDLVDHFFDTNLLLNDTFDPSNFMNGIAQRVAEKVDSFLAGDLTNLLFADEVGENETRWGLDLFAVNIQRGREHGIPDYNSWRAFCGFKKFDNFTEMSDSGSFTVEVATLFSDVYDNVDDIDLYPAGISETNDESTENGILGPTFRCILEKQFKSLKFGDRFWYQNTASPHPFSATQIAAITGITFSAIFCEHTSNQNMRTNAFLMNSVVGNDQTNCNNLFNSTYLEDLMAAF